MGGKVNTFLILRLTSKEWLSS